MEKYVLLCCYERDFEAPQFYDTFEAAQNAMCGDYEAMRVDEDADDDDDEDGDEYAFDHGIDDMSAFINGSDWNCDWKIFKVNL